MILQVSCQYLELQSSMHCQSCCGMEFRVLQHQLNRTVTYPIHDKDGELQYFIGGDQPYCLRKCDGKQVCQCRDLSKRSRVNTGECRRGRRPLVNMRANEELRGSCAIEGKTKVQALSNKYKSIRRDYVCMRMLRDCTRVTDCWGCCHRRKKPNEKKTNNTVF